MACSMINSAVITPVLAGGSVATPFIYQVNISQRLCCSTCVAQTPVFTPSFSLVGYSNVGNDAFVATIHVEGVIAYTPCNGSPCCTKAQVLSQNFTIPFYFDGTPGTVSIQTGTPVNVVAGSPCQNCSRSFVSEIPLYLTVTA